MGKALSHLATHVLLDPSGRRHLRKGLQALLHTAPFSLPPWIRSLASEESWRGRHPFQFGLDGSAVLSPPLQREEGVAIERIYERQRSDGSPPHPVRGVIEGSVVRVLMEDTKSRPTLSAG